MNTQFNSNVIWLQLEYKISTLSFFKKGDTIQGGTLFEEIGYPKKVLYGAKLISFSKLKTPSEITTPLLE